MPHSWSQVCPRSCHCFLVKCHVFLSRSIFFPSPQFWIICIFFLTLFEWRPLLSSFYTPPALDLSSVLMCLTQCFFDSPWGGGGEGGPSPLLSCSLELLSAAFGQHSSRRLEVGDIDRTDKLLTYKWDRCVSLWETLRCLKGPSSVYYISQYLFIIHDTV